MLSNIDKWKSITSSLPSPDNYIAWSFRYLIAASLQRRVWCGPEHLKCYPNLYILLVGPPGTGKGLVIKQVSSILKEHELTTNSFNAKAITSESDKTIASTVAEQDLKAAHNADTFGKSSTKIPERKLLIPVAANASTYEALTMAMASSYRRINFVEWNEEQKKQIMQIYGHSSLCFCLEEIASLFRKRTEDLVNFLLEAYDCGDYEYDTKTQGKTKIRRCCLNFFGGTTPDFMQNVFDDKLLNQGFSSRTFFIYAAKNRKNVFWVPELTPEQKKHRADISAHVKELSKLYGAVKIDPSTQTYLIDWWDKEQTNPSGRPNQSIRMIPYYARKNIHVMKLAISLHFSDSLEMHVPQERFEEAIDILAQEEQTMHLALELDGHDERAKSGRKVCRYLESNGKKTFQEVWMEFYNSVPRKTDMEEILSDLVTLGKLNANVLEDGDTKEQKLWYSIR